MPYQHLEEMRSRKKEKVALFLTAENLGGLMVTTMPVYVATATFHSFGLRMLLLGLAAALGLALTLEYGGLAAYERLLWRLRGVMRQRTAGAVLTPEQFSPVQTGALPVALPVNGPVRRGDVPRVPASEQPAPVVQRAALPVALTARPISAIPQEPIDAHV